MDSQYEITKYNAYELGQVAQEIPYEVRDECYKRNQKIAKEIKKLEKRLAKLNLENKELFKVFESAQRAI